MVSLHSTMYTLIKYLSGFLYIRYTGGIGAQQSDDFFIVYVGLDFLRTHVVIDSISLLSTIVASEVSDGQKVISIFPGHWSILVLWIPMKGLTRIHFSLI